MTDAFMIAGGSAVIAATIWEVFSDLFRPAHSGALSDWIGRQLFQLLRRHQRFTRLAGPAAIVLVIGAWVLLLVTGFALVYYPLYPGHFRTSIGEVPSHAAHFATVFYFSFETLITLGYGEFVPESTISRMLAVSEGLIGFGLLTASVSSIVLLYPALARMRHLARTVSQLRAAERRTGVSIVSGGGEGLLAALARDVTNTRIDLLHFPVIYYFATRDREASLAHWTTALGELAGEGLEAAAPAVRLAAAALDSALDDLAEVLADRFVHSPSRARDAIFTAYAAHHHAE